MQYIIFGCGVDGKKALSFIGKDRILFFCDNNKCGSVIHDIQVVSVEEIGDILNDNIKIVIASTKYQNEMRMQLEQLDIRNYLLFNPNLIPQYALYENFRLPSCREIIEKYEIEKYEKIAIYGHGAIAEFFYNELSEGKQVVICNSKKEIDLLQCEVLLITTARCEDDVREELYEEPIYSAKIIDIFDVYKFEKELQRSEIIRYKDIYKGKRIFVIGNGPSLKIEDLDKLHEYGEICIAANRMYKVYDETPFRPNYLCFSDVRVIKDCEEDIKHLTGEIIISDRFDNLIEGVQYIHAICEPFYPFYPGFSNDLTWGFYDGYTVTYDIGIQLAAYMGASEIYLLGVDFNFTNNVTDNSNYFIKNYYKDEEKEKYLATGFQKEVIKKAYEKAEIYSRKNNFRIYNATRGGKLEVFERVDFDSLFKR